MSLLIAACACWVGSDAHADPDAGDAAPAASLIASLSDGLELALLEQADSQRRTERVRRWVDTVFDIEGIAAFTLGDHWHTAAAAQQQAFRRALVAHLAQVVVRLLGTPGASVATSGKLETSGPFTRVFATLRTNEGEMPFVLVLRKTGGAQRVFDVVVGPYSTVTLKKSEFRSMVRRAGGLEALISALER